MRRATWGACYRWVPRCSLAAILAALATTGCAIHYSNSKLGQELTLGASQVTLAFKDLTNGWVSVSSGNRFPGLVLGIGPDFWGLSFGYTIRERMTVVRSNELAQYYARLDGQIANGNLHRRWRFTRSEIVRPGGSRTVLVTGQAVAGLAATVDSGSPRLHAGRHDVLLTRVAPDSDIFFEIGGGTNAWPHFDFPAMETQFSIATETTEPTTKPGKP